MVTIGRIIFFEIFFHCFICPAGLPSNVPLAQVSEELGALPPASTPSAYLDQNSTPVHNEKTLFEGAYPDCGAVEGGSGDSTVVQGYQGGDLGYGHTGEDDNLQYPTTPTLPDPDTYISHMTTEGAFDEPNFDSTMVGGQVQTFEYFDPASKQYIRTAGPPGAPDEMIGGPDSNADEPHSQGSEGIPIPGKMAASEYGYGESMIGSIEHRGSPYYVQVDGALHEPPVQGWGDTTGLASISEGTGGATSNQEMHLGGEMIGDDNLSHDGCLEAMSHNEDVKMADSFPATDVVFDEDDQDHNAVLSLEQGSTTAAPSSSEVQVNSGELQLGEPVGEGLSETAGALAVGGESPECPSESHEDIVGHVAEKVSSPVGKVQSVLGSEIPQQEVDVNVPALQALEVPPGGGIETDEQCTSDVPPSDLAQQGGKGVSDRKAEAHSEEDIHSSLPPCEEQVLPPGEQQQVLPSCKEGGEPQEEGGFESETYMGIAGVNNGKRNDESEHEKEEVNERMNEAEMDEWRERVHEETGVVEVRRENSIVSDGGDLGPSSLMEFERLEEECDFEIDNEGVAAPSLTPPCEAGPESGPVDDQVPGAINALCQVLPQGTSDQTSPSETRPEQGHIEVQVPGASAAPVQGLPQDTSDPTPGTNQCGPRMVCDCVSAMDDIGFVPPPDEGAESKPDFCSPVMAVVAPMMPQEQVSGDSGIGAMVPGEIHKDRPEDGSGVYLPVHSAISESIQVAVVPPMMCQAPAETESDDEFLDAEGGVSPDAFTPKKGKEMDLKQSDLDLESTLEGLILADSGFESPDKKEGFDHIEFAKGVGDSKGRSTPNPSKSSAESENIEDFEKECADVKNIIDENSGVEPNSERFGVCPEDVQIEIVGTGDVVPPSSAEGDSLGEGGELGTASLVHSDGPQLADTEGPSTDGAVVPASAIEPPHSKHRVSPSHIDTSLPPLAAPGDDARIAHEDQAQTDGVEGSVPDTKEDMSAGTSGGVVRRGVKGSKGEKVSPPPTTEAGIAPPDCSPCGSSMVPRGGDSGDTGEEGVPQAPPTSQRGRGSRGRGRGGRGGKLTKPADGQQTKPKPVSRLKRPGFIRPPRGRALANRGADFEIEILEPDSRPKGGSFEVEIMEPARRGAGQEESSETGQEQAAILDRGDNVGGKDEQLGRGMVEAEDGIQIFEPQRKPGQKPSLGTSSNILKPKPRKPCLELNPDDDTPPCPKSPSPGPHVHIGLAESPFVRPEQRGKGAAAAAGGREKGMSYRYYWHGVLPCLHGSHAHHAPFSHKLKVRNEKNCTSQIISKIPKSLYFILILILPQFSPSRKTFLHVLFDFYYDFLQYPLVCDFYL